MSLQAERSTRIDAEASLSVGRVQLVRNVWRTPIDLRGMAAEHHLELSLLPNTGEPRGCFPDLWGPRRFEPIGELFLLPAAQTFHARSRCRQQHSLICRFDPRAVDEWFDGELRWTDRRLKGGLNIASRPLRTLLAAMAAELRQPGFASAAMIDLMAAQGAIELSRHLSAMESVGTVGGLATWQLRRIDERIAGDSVPPSLSELAQLCGISPRHLTRAFRVSRGCSIGEHLAAHRIGRSQRLLATGVSVKAVAYTLGFTAPSNFAAAFRRATGESPRQYQQRSTRAAVKH